MRSSCLLNTQPLRSEKKQALMETLICSQLLPHEMHPWNPSCCSLHGVRASRWRCRLFPRQRPGQPAQVEWLDLEGSGLFWKADTFFLDPHFRSGVVLCSSVLHLPSVALGFSAGLFFFFFRYFSTLYSTVRKQQRACPHNRVLLYVTVEFQIITCYKFQVMISINSPKKSS